jgi:transposase
MHRIAAKFVLRVLTQDQKDSRVAICQELKETVKNDPTLLLNIITGDESIVYAYDPETKLQSSRWKSPGSPRPKKARMQKSKLKTMLICFFDQEGIVHREFVPPGMTVNADFYCDVLRRLRENVWRKRPQKWRNQNLIIHHDRSFKVSQFLAKNNMTVIPHPPYSPDLASCDFFLFPKLKLRMKGQTFDTTEEIQEESQRVLDTIPKRDFQGCFQAWQKRWDRCIRAKGEYFEGDGGI